MPKENTCIFCDSPLNGEDICPWCGFSQQGRHHIPGTLEYGRKVDIYVVGGVITMDGESTSYSAYDTVAGRRVLLKEFLPVSMVGAREGDILTIQPGKEVLFKNLMMDFEDLYKGILQLKHPAAQPVYKVFSANDTVYAALRPARGDTLARSMIKQARPYTFKEARWIFRDLFSLLSKLAGQNIVHGGISDETVIIDSEGKAMLTGFAIRDLRLKNDHIMYKLYEGFSAPEQYRQNEFPGTSVDVYSAAALFYYAVTGKTYTAGDLDKKEPMRGVPRHVVTRLKAALAPDPADRVDIDDFVLLLDGKAEVEKPPKPAGKQSIKIPANVKKAAPAVAVVVILAIFAFTMFKLNSSVTPSSSSGEIDGSDVSAFVNEIPVPYLVGRTYADIMDDRELNRHLFFSITEDYSDSYPEGYVTAQSPEEGTVVSRGAIIYLTVSKGEKLQTVPYDLAGKSVSEVEGILNGLGIKYAFKEVVRTEQYPYGVVAGTDKPAGSTIKPGDYLIVYVSDASIQ